MGITRRDDGDFTPFWYTDTGYVVRWVIFLVILALVLLYVVGGYFHAKSRIKKGLPLLGYHSCLVSRRHRPYNQQYHYYANQQNPQYGNDAHNMNYMPPPVYDPNRPPAYTAPPAGGTKIEPSQWRSEQPSHPPESSTSGVPGLADVQPPPGPPPSSAQRQ